MRRIHPYTFLSMNIDKSKIAAVDEQINQLREQVQRKIALHKIGIELIESAEEAEEFLKSTHSIAYKIEAELYGCSNFGDFLDDIIKARREFVGDDIEMIINYGDEAMEEAFVEFTKSLAARYAQERKCHQDDYGILFCYCDEV